MSLKNKSEIDMISGPEFINLQPLDINPLVDSCQIKVFYLGHNRNGSYINKATAEKMATTLRGTPIVAAYNDTKEDFGDHGHIMHIEDGEVSFSCKTIPYGFVAPDAEVWFQNFIDTDEFGNQVERTYLMTTGYLWTGQFQELKKVIEEGQPHSMELDENSIDGHWAKDNNLGVEFFIINDAVFSKLCILGDDVEPCFEGSSVTASVEKDFTNSNEFSRTLFTMMNELTEALQSKGGLDMPENGTQQIDDNSAVTDFAEEAVIEEPVMDESAAEPVIDEPADYTDASDAQVEDDFERKDDDKDDSSDDNDSDDADDDEDEKKSYSLEEYEAVQSELEALRAEIEGLREFKLQIENEQKDALIDSFPYNTLSAEDKKDIMEHKSEYSLDEIKAKLAVMYVEKGLQFSVEEDEKPEEDPITTFTLDGEVSGGIMSGLQAALHKTVEN